MKVIKIFFLLIFSLACFKNYIFADEEEDKRLAMDLFNALCQKLPGCKDIRSKFKLADEFKRKQPKYLQLVNCKGFAESLFESCGYEEKNTKKIEVCAALDMQIKLTEVLDSCEKVSLIIRAQDLAGETLIDYARKFKLETIVEILENYKNALD